MTKSGCLDFDPEIEGCGLWVRPRDIEDWRAKMNLLTGKPDHAAEMGKKGREIVERNFCPNRFGVDVVDFLKTIIQ
jgi:hypothetical protein